MRNSIDYVGTTAKKRREYSVRTVRKSRRLAMKRRRQRRASVADALGLTPTREEVNGDDLQQMAAEQLAIAAATNDVRQSGKAKKKQTRTGKRRDDDGPLFDYTRSLFNSPVTPRAGDLDTTEESDPFEEPDTEDRNFIKSDGASASDGDYLPTDPDEFNSELEESSSDRARRSNNRADYYSLETKNNKDDYRGRPLFTLANYH